MHEGIEALNRQTEARLKETEAGLRETQIQARVAEKQIGLAEVRARYAAEQFRRVMWLVAGILALVATVVVALILKDDETQAVTILTTAVIALLSLFAGKSVLRGALGQERGDEE